MNNKPPFTKKELKEYIEQRGYTADIEEWWDWLIVTGFTYSYGKQLIPLKPTTWKADVNMKLRHGKFHAKKKPVPKPVEKQPEIIPITAEQKANFRKQFNKLVKKWDSA